MAAAFRFAPGVTVYDLYQDTADPGLKAELKAAIEKTPGNENMIPHRKTFRDFIFLVIIGLNRYFFAPE